ncbi:serine/threonine-protein kinase [Sorangium sp. So ce1000]|uniref:serine/threonine-protein kinase n=1 Tax=Sorangium sp. So ce1000 TaxID=3133325 RepID=UPI003F5F3D38
MSSNMTQAFEHTSGECFDVGTVVGDKYQLLRKAGEGAMGSVWVATNTALEANVAIKVLRPEMRSPAIAERLLREARAAAKLSHPGIVRVFDLGKTAGGTPYIVMELLEGEALRDVLCRERRLTPEAALAILLPVASAMHAAHERGIVHRDLKPDNVMLANQGDGRTRPKVVDFGIAKVTWTEPESGSTGAAVIGTPQYMPPEQALGQGQLDHRADIWALCTMLYEALAGETPFAGEQGFGTLRAIIQDPVRSLVERCGTDPALWSIIERGLRKDPAGRWGNMRELGVALATWLVARGVSEDVCGASLRAQWLDERTSQLPAPSPRPIVVSSAPTLHSRRADDSMELQLPMASAQRAPGVAARRTPVSVGRKGIEESGERAWSEATAMVNLPGAPSPSMRPSLRERVPFRGIAAAGFVVLTGAAVWSVALGKAGPAAEPTLASPAEPAVAAVAEVPSLARPAPEARSLTASVAPGSAALPAEPAAPPAEPAAPPAEPAAPPAEPAAPRPARALKAAAPAHATPAPAAAAAAPTAVAAPTATAPAATGKPPAAASSPSGPPVADAGVEAPAPPAQPVPAGSTQEPRSSGACPSGGGREGGEAACPPAPEASTSAVERHEDAGVAEQQPGTRRPATEEPPPSPDAGATEGSSSAPAAP